MKNIIFILVSFLTLTSCDAQQGKEVVNKVKAETMQTDEMGTNGLIHTVYFWLTDDVTEERKKEFEQALIDLGKVPSIDKYYWGTPAATTSRDVVDSSYDYAINVFFKSIEAEAEYQIDPLHLEFVEGQKAIFKKVIVYNNLY